MEIHLDRWKVEISLLITQLIITPQGKAHFGWRFIPAQILSNQELALLAIPNQSLQSRYYLEVPKGILFVCFPLKLGISHSYFGSPLRNEKNVQSGTCIHTLTVASSNSPGGRIAVQDLLEKA